MKKHLLFISLTVMLMATSVVLTVEAQSIPNGNLESWTTGIYNVPSNYIQNSNAQNFYAGLPFNVVREDTATYGSCPYAVQLTTVGSGSNTNFGYFLNTNPQNSNDPLQWTGGFPYAPAQGPTGIRGWYKSDIQAGDTALVFTVLRGEGSAIAFAIIKLTGTHTGWTLFTAPIAVIGIGTIDSVIFGATSSDALNNIQVSGSTITLDSISFTGTSTQPALLDGNFANWETDTLATPNSWYLNTNGNLNGVSRTTDAHNGQYAIELQTYLGNNNNQPEAQAATIGTGYYPQNCNSNCNEQGGYPDTMQVDTLVFWYKYVPSGNDSAQVNITFKKNGSSISNMGQNLGASSSYQQVVIPISLGQTPDTVIVSFQSSIYQDSVVSYAGSDLKIDLVYLTSQPITTGIKEMADNVHLNLYPNPFSTSATFEVDANTDIRGMQLRISDVTGRTINNTALTSHLTTIMRNNLSPGVYLYELTNSQNIVKTGKLIIE